MNKIYEMFHEGLYDQIITYTPENVAKTLLFLDNIRLAYRLLYNNDWNNDLQEYSLKLFKATRDLYPNEWNANWEYNALLGIAC